MKKLLNSKQMKECDKYTSEHFGVQPVVLMERAALSTSDAMVAYCGLGRGKRVLVMCGTGNNGADGLALARILYENSIPVSFYVPQKDGKHSELFDLQKKILENYGVCEVSADKKITVADLEEYDIIVDALFGIGLSRPLSDDICELIEKVNAARAVRVSMDIPTGINADTGALMGEAFKADLTVTFGFAKIGLMLYPGRKYTGKLVLAQIGITEKSLKNFDTALLEETDVIKTLPIRANDGNKGTFGKVLIFAGSPEMTGAAVMVSRSAFKSGAGMVKVVTYREIASVIQNSIPEVMVTTLSKDDDKSEQTSKLADAVNWADVVLMGPGIGVSNYSKEIMEELIELSKDKPIVIDADGLNILSEDENLPILIKGRTSLTVVTPHVGELSRLIKESVSTIKNDFIAASVKAANDYKCCVVAKDAVTCATDGEDSIVIASGNNGMATAGSGDVLAGIIAAFMANKSETAQSGDEVDRMKGAVANAVYVHGMAGSECLKKMPEDSLMASDILNMIPTVLSKIRIQQ